MKVTFNIAESEQKAFVKACEAAITSVGYSTKQGLIEAANAIMMESQSQVPRKTGTLANSAFAGVSRRVDVKGYRYGAILGYGQYQGVGSIANLGSQEGGIEWLWRPTNPKNPISGLPAAVYASKVHENLVYKHPNGGKAKFLEDPIRAWASGRFNRTMAEYWKIAIERLSTLTQTQLSNKDLQYAMNHGKIDADLPSKPEILTKYDGRNLPSRAVANQYAAAMKEYAKRMEAYHTALSIRSKPSRGYRKSGYGETVRDARYIAIKHTKYTPKHQSSKTWGRTRKKK